MMHLLGVQSWLLALCLGPVVLQLVISLCKVSAADVADKYVLLYMALMLRLPSAEVCHPGATVD